MTQVVIPFRVGDVWDPLPRQEDDSHVWTATWRQTASPIFSITFARRSTKVRDLNADQLRRWDVATRKQEYGEVMANVEDAFGGTMDDLGALYDDEDVKGRTGKGVFVTVSDLATMAKRCHAAQVGDAEQTAMGTADFEISIRYSDVCGITFKTTIAVDFEDPGRFDRLDTRSLERMAHLEMDCAIDSTEREDTPAPEVSSFGEATEVSGDIYARPMSEVGVVTELEPLQEYSLEEAEAGPLGDAVLCVDVSPTAKYSALANAILACTRREHAVFVAGDSPGTLGQALVARGSAVFGVDPKNRTTTYPGLHGRGQYEQVRGEVRAHARGCEVIDDVGNPRTVPPDIGCYVVDTGTDDEDAASATARNLQIGWSIKRQRADAFVVCQLRSMPTIAGDYGLISLPGHSNQGCEVYAVLSVAGARNFGVNGLSWRHYCWAWARLEPDMGGTEWLDSHDRFKFWIADREEWSATVVKLFFEPWATDTATDGEPNVAYAGEGALSTWYHFIVTRAFAEAHKYSRRGACAATLEASNPVALLAGLNEAFGHEAGSGNVESVFGVDYAEGLTGVTPGLFKRHPTLRRIVRSRYDAIARLLSYEVGAVDSEVMGLFSQPASGVLLRGLSTMRNMDDEWGGPIFAKYKRVLPYELMACLASRVLYKAAYMYAFACMHGLGKPMHAWEMQHMLWSLTMHGTMEERLRYIRTRLSGAVKPLATGRRAPHLGPMHDGYLGSFERNLRVLELADAYSSVDKQYDAARQRIFARTRDIRLRPDRARRGDDALMPPPERPPSKKWEAPPVGSRGVRKGKPRGMDLAAAWAKQ